MEVTDSNFQETVLERSKTTPVLVDFWAEWCGPCRMIGPVLEKLEQEMAGRFILAKLDTDHNQYTARQYGISSIPAVKLFLNGEVAQEFLGALPEPRIRSFLEENLPDPRAGELETLSLENPVEAARKVLEMGLSGKSADELLWKGVQGVLSSNENLSSRILEMETFLRSIPEVGSLYSDGKKYLMEFLERKPPEENLNQLKNLFQEGEERLAMDYFLKKVEESQGKERERARDDLVACFFLLGNSHPLVNDYRRRLATTLY